LRTARAYLAVLDDEESGRSAGQDSALAPIAQAEECNVGEVKRFVDALEPIPFQVEEAAIRSRPEFTAAVFEDHADELVGQPVVRAIGAKAAVAIMKQSASVGRNPQRSVMSNSEVADV